jgi:hypothetical protein
MNYLNFNEIVLKAKNDREFPIKYLTDLFNYVNDNLNLPISCDTPLAAIKCFIPLPTRLLLSEIYSGQNKIVKLNNEYQFHGKIGLNRLVFSDKILPFLTNLNFIKFPIPFSFPIYNDKNVEIVLSNVYYYELTLDSKKNINFNSINECVSIGFGHKFSNFNSHVGWYDDSFGYHSDDGSIRFNNTNGMPIKTCNPWDIGDVIGAGIIFTGRNMILPFFTHNGKIVYQHDKPIEITQAYFPMIGYDHTHSIKLNFSTSKFKFNIKKFIHENSNNIISTENSFSTNHDISYFLNDLPNINNKYKLVKLNLDNINSSITTTSYLNSNITNLSYFNTSMTPSITTTSYLNSNITNLSYFNTSMTPSTSLNIEMTVSNTLDNLSSIILNNSINETLPILNLTPSPNLYNLFLGPELAINPDLFIDFQTDTITNPFQIIEPDDLEILDPSSPTEINE